MSETPKDPQRYECDSCFSKPGYPCTQPTDFSRRDVTWFHLARKGAANV